MEMTRERISFTFDLRDMVLLLQIGFSFVKAAVTCAILVRTSGFEPLSVTTVPMHLKPVTVSSFYHFTLVSLWMVVFIAEKIKLKCQVGPEICHVSYIIFVHDRL